MAEPVIRVASSQDADAVLDLMDELFAPPGIKPDDYDRDRSQANLRRYVEGESGDVLLAFDGDSLVGLASVYVDIPSIRFGTRCWLEDLVVTSGRRSTGIGKLLLDAATEWARVRECTHLELDSGDARKDAHRFYRDQGMEQQGYVFHRTIPQE